MDTNTKGSAPASEREDALATKEDSREQSDSTEAAISFAIEWPNLGGG